MSQISQMSQMSRTITIDREEFVVREDEFVRIQHPEYNNLILYSHLAALERLVYLVRDVQRSIRPFNVATDERSASAFGGYLHHQLVRTAPKKDEWIWVSLYTHDEETKLPDNVQIAITPDSTFELDGTEFTSLPWKQNACFVHLHPKSWDVFQYVFYRNIIIDLAHKNDDEALVFDYDNLLHLVMIVKNAGPGFAQILERNIPYIDRWTILDTGSTDTTVETIRQVLAPRVRGNLFEEPFVDFGTSRNRALELAGDACKFTIMLDDTYYVTGDLREFLSEIRSDQFADSFSLYINSHDVQYTSNRILKSQRKLKYIFKIHEVIQDYDNVNVIVPPERAQICDEQSPYMQERTTNRKELDLQLLHDSIREDPTNPRHWYYVAQTYVGMKNYEQAYRYFLARVFHPVDGFIQEKVDACFEAGRIAHFQLKKPWEEVLPLYERAHTLDPTRPDPIYFIGIQAYLEGRRQAAFEKFKQAFQLGYPVHAQYSLKPTLSFCYTPKFLAELAYEQKEYALGRATTELYLQKTGPDPFIQSWNAIYRQMERFQQAQKELPQQSPYKYDDTRPLVVFVADGNWNRWSARDLELNGLGGSETYIVEMARWMQRSGKYNVVVFCRCRTIDLEGEWTDERVHYLDLEYLYTFLHQHPIQALIVSRFSEYVPLGLNCKTVENVFLVAHDLTVTGLHIPLNPPKLKQVFVLSEWHQEYFTNYFPQLKPLTSPLHYGISFPEECVRDPHPAALTRFIYSSFPNRGLLPLLQMWPRIRARIPTATLEIFADLEHKWTNANYPDMMTAIKNLLKQLEGSGIEVRGWVKKAELYRAWKDADIWLYPCIFQETFCLTALEAAASNTLVIAADLAALKNTVGDRGFLIEGDPQTTEWQEQALSVLERCLSDPALVEESIRRNREWALSHSWKTQAEQFMTWIDRFPFEFDGHYDLPPLSKHPRAQRALAIHDSAGIGVIREMFTQPQLKVDSLGVHPPIFDRNLTRAALQDRISSVAQLNGSYDLVHYEVREEGQPDVWRMYSNLCKAWKLVHPFSGRMVVHANQHTRPVIDAFQANYRHLYAQIDNQESGVVLQKHTTCIHLVLYSPSEYFAPMYELTRQYYLRFPTVKTIYYAFSEDLDEELRLEDDLLWIRGKEQYNPDDPQHSPGLFEKTIKALAWVQRRYGDAYESYEYVVRSNISTVVNFDVLLPLLAHQSFHYGGVQTLCFPPYDPFIRGICILFSNALVKQIVEHRAQMNPEMVDDIGLAQLIQRHIEPVLPGSYPPSFTFADRLCHVPDCKGDREALAKVVRGDHYACYRFKVQEHYGVFTATHDPSRATDLEQMRIVLQLLQ